MVFNFKNSGFQTQMDKDNPLRMIFKFFSSLKLAIIILVSLMMALAAGTIIESFHGVDAGKLLVYDTFWFNTILLLLGINVACAALDRIPWKVKHVGFVITHLGIIIILVGSFMTKKMMVDGQMAIPEKGKESFITLMEPVIYIFSEKTGKDWLVSIPKKPFAWEGRKQVIGAKEKQFPFELTLLKNYPRAESENLIVPNDKGKAAIYVRLKSSFIDQSLWLMENDPEIGKIPLGPATIQFGGEALKAPSWQVPKTGYLEFQFEKGSFYFPLDFKQQLPYSAPLEGTPYTITIERLFRNGVMKGKDLIDQQGSGNELKNPAADIMLRGNGVEERHLIFANFPDFPTQHGFKPSAVALKIFYRLPDSGSKGESHEIRFRTEGGKLIYQIRKGPQIQEGQVQSGKEISTGWMDLNFSVDSFFPHAVRQRAFNALSHAEAEDDVPGAIQIELKSQAETKQVWMAQGSREVVEMNGDKLHFIFGRKRIPAGFEINLKEFRVQQYPGTSKPASFESTVELKDGAYTSKETIISMNKPLEYKGYKIYQAAYQEGVEGEPTVSVFAVGKDPGVPVKYAGAIVMIMGITLMFYTKKFSSNAGKIQ